MTGIIREQGPTGFVSVRAPDRVFCNGKDVTKLLVKESSAGPVDIYTVVLDVKSGRAVLEIRWDGV